MALQTLNRAVAELGYFLNYLCAEKYHLYFFVIIISVSIHEKFEARMYTLPLVKLFPILMLPRSVQLWFFVPLDHLIKHKCVLLYRTSVKICSVSAHHQCPTDQTNFDRLREIF